LSGPRRASLFVDAGGWIDTIDPRDKHSAAATEFFRDAAFSKYAGLVTTNLVVAETHASLIGARDRHTAIRFLTLIESSARVNIVYSNREVERRAMQILIKYADQDLSYCDAVSFAVMKELGIRDAFAFDSHFGTMGFRRLPDTGRKSSK
jgi:predicted nucleic acid-binding protein